MIVNYWVLCRSVLFFFVFVGLRKYENTNATPDFAVLCLAWLLVVVKNLIIDNNNKCTLDFL